MAWFDGQRIDEVAFCKSYLAAHPMVSVGGTFFTADGLVSDENLLKKEIYDLLKPHFTTGLTKKVSNLLEVLRLECCTDALPVYTDRIHTANGTFYLDGRFSEEKDFCRNRLPVRYNPNVPVPEAWLRFCQ